MSTVQAKDVEPGMLLERLDHTTVGRPAYVRAAVETVRPFNVGGDNVWHRITWSGGAAGVYAPTTRFIIVPPA